MLARTPDHPFVVVGPTEIIRDVLCGPQQHNEHCKGWRWHQFIGDREARWEAVKAELKKMHAERRLAAMEKV